jgi:hypothetical protein
MFHLNNLQAYEAYFSTIPFFSFQKKDVPIFRHFFLMVANAPEPFDAHQWLKSLDNKDFKQLLHFYHEDNKVFLIMLSWGLRAKMGNIDLLNDVGESVAIKEAYMFRLKALIAAVAGGMPQHFPFLI